MKALTLEQVLDRLASADPTPGGGSAAALGGATAAALVTMVARISQGKGGNDAAFAGMIERGERSRAALLAFIAEDAQAFNAVMRAMRLPRSTDEEKRARQAALQRALRGAAEVPLRVAREVLSALRVAPDLARTGNPNALSDMAAAALLGYAAVNGALYNVRVNLKGIKDEAYVAETAGEVERLNRASAALRDAAMAAVRERM